MPQPELLVGAAAALFDHDGNLVDQSVLASVEEVVEALRGWTIRIRPSRLAA
jgi:hypothetical protein